MKFYLKKMINPLLIVIVWGLLIAGCQREHPPVVPKRTAAAHIYTDSLDFKRQYILRQLELRVAKSK